MKYDRMISVCMLSLLIVLMSAYVISAAMLVNSEELNNLRGGCLKCGLKTCQSTNVACKAKSDGTCFDGSTTVGCNNTKKERDIVADCGSGGYFDPPCERGDKTGCGRQWNCSCDDCDPETHWGTCNSYWYQWNDHYYPCK